MAPKPSLDLRHDFRLGEDFHEEGVLSGVILAGMDSRPQELRSEIFSTSGPA